MFRSKIYFIGMGGSGIVGDLMKVILEKKKYEVNVIKDYNLPSFINKNANVFFISYSGNTYETLSCIKQAIKRGLRKIVVVTSNGKLEQIAMKNKFKIIKVRKGLLPREAIFNMLFPLLKLFKVKFKDRNYDFSSFDFLLDIINESLRVFAITEYYPIALRMVNQFNENCKLSFIVGSFPEVLHNQIEALSNKNILIFRNGGEKLIDAFKEVLKEKANIYEIIPKEKEFVNKIIYLLKLVDYLSIKYATKNNIDYKKTPFIDNYKALLH
ncbi:MAG: SIS domain-containing protein [Candidatus Aenigmatarchaeota archaeon]